MIGNKMAFGMSSLLILSSTYSESWK